MLDLTAGAGPNFMKLAPLVRALAADGGLPFRIVHTGQHYDPAMTDVFFEELGIPAPDVHLDVGSGSHGAQTARILERYEAHLLERSASATVVFGDVNSTVACALAAVKLRIPVVHVEAGLRSFDVRCRRRSTAFSPTRCRIYYSSPNRRRRAEPENEGSTSRKRSWSATG